MCYSPSMEKAHKAAEYGGRMRHEKNGLPSPHETKRMACAAVSPTALSPPQTSCSAFTVTMFGAKQPGFPQTLCCEHKVRRFVSLRELQKENGASVEQQKNPHRSIELLRRGRKNFITKKPIFRKPLAKRQRICYNIPWAPVIRLYRSFCLDHFYAGLSYCECDSLPFCLRLYYTPNLRICQYVCRKILSPPQKSAKTY